ncbi:unnamed protein product [Arabis nemorensis]|uniref:NB-ARC domain-containing protein n=1 Tax=Arabis nemorensis TaxID=586526 RepID=A0A565CFW9_9BRAS|nr:unnamed protein product [Arabis nemorensis]
MDTARPRQERKPEKDTAISRQEMKDLNLCKKIVETLGGEGPQRVVLIGKSGIGKTRLAQKVGEYAAKEGLCYLTLCLHLNKRFDDELSLYENIAFQMEVYDREETKAKDLLKEKISAELSRKKRDEDKIKLVAEKSAKKLARGEKKQTSTAATVPYLLLILDDEGNKTSEDKVMKDLGLDSFLNEYESNLKVLITRREREGNTTECDDEIKSRDTKSEDNTEPCDLEEPHDTRSEVVAEPDADTKFHGEIEFHTTDESQALHETLTEDGMLDLFESLIEDKSRHLLESLQKDWKIVVKKSMSFPAAIVVLAKSLNCITRQKAFKSFSPKQEKVLKEGLSHCEPACSDSGYNPILHLAYELLETDDALKSAIIDCFWHSLDFFMHCGCVYYRHLITQWILEGYFDPVRSVKKAYKEGHDILLELINRGILKTQEDDMVVPEMAMSNLIDLRLHGLLGRSRLRFARVYGDDKKGLGNITQIDDMIKTVQAKKGENIFTILVSGNRLRRETPKEFFEQPQMKDLEVLGLFKPTLEHLLQSLSKLNQLRVLVIRDYDLLPSMEELKDLRRLEVLEVSGASSVKIISDDVFLAVPKLQSLNLSGLGIISLPASISQLKQLYSLILRDIFNLEALPTIEGLKSLEVFDVCGCTKLHKIEGSFKDMSYLREVNLSGTRIEALPELPLKSSICCSKLFVHADSRRMIHDTWSQVKEAITNGMSESLSCSDMVDRLQEISRKEPGRVDELWAFDCPEKKGRGAEHFRQGHRYRDVYMNTIPFVDTKSYQEVLEIRGSNAIDQDKETLAKAEFVVFVDIGAASLSSIFNDLKSVKGCWVEMCGDIENLFSGVDEERLRNLETLSITNLGRLESIYSSSSFKNLKKLNIDCCPSIKSLFPDASQLPGSLEVLKIKSCEKLENVFIQVVEVPNLHTLCLFKLPMLSTIGAMFPKLVTCKPDQCPELKTAIFMVSLMLCLSPHCSVFSIVGSSCSCYCFEVPK